jgi:hypothetical protein
VDPVDALTVTTLAQLPEDRAMALAGALEPGMAIMLPAHRDHFVVPAFGSETWQ